MGKNKKAAYSKREEEKANRIVKGLFIGLIVYIKTLWDKK